ncbi:MAG: chordopoxvirus fusion protein [Thermodesulfovibrionales bacterium]
MIDTLEFMNELKEAFEPLQAERLARLMGRLYKELANTVTKVEFEELRKTVSQLSDNVKELSEAQKRTEQAVAELAEAQKRTEQRVEELAQAQKKTEERLTRLEQVVEELAEAQKRTEEEIRKLARGLEDTREQLGGLSDTVGYTLENEAFKALPALLKRDYGLIVKGRLKRGYLADKTGRPVEVNIIGEATKNGKKVTIIGEGKARLSKKAVNEFIEKRLKKLEPLFKEVFPVLVTHMISEPDVEEYARDKGIALYYSYDF